MKITKQDLSTLSIFLVVVTALYATIGTYVFPDQSLSTRLIMGVFVGFISGCSGIYHRKIRERRKIKKQ